MNLRLIFRVRLEVERVEKSSAELSYTPKVNTLRSITVCFGLTDTAKHDKRALEALKPTEMW